MDGKLWVKLCDNDNEKNLLSIYSAFRVIYLFLSLDSKKQQLKKI